MRPLTAARNLWCRAGPERRGLAPRDGSLHAGCSPGPATRGGGIWGSVPSLLEVAELARPQSRRHCGKGAAVLQGELPGSKSQPWHGTDDLVQVTTGGHHSQPPGTKLSPSTQVGLAQPSQAGLLAADSGGRN